MRSKPEPVPERHPSTPTRTWANSVGTYIAGRAHVDEVDKVAAEMEAKWGCDRLRLVVGPELREKFDRQRYLMNQAIWHGTLDDIIREAPRTVRAYRALDKAATEAGEKPISTKVWELALSSGNVVAIVQDDDYAPLVRPEGRRVAVYSLAEIGRLLEAYPALAKAKEVFPGAEITRITRRVPDSLDAIDTSSYPIDKELPDDEIPF